MSPLEFLKAVWPTHGLYCLATIFKTPEGHALYSHKVFDTIDAAAAFAARHKDEDIYFCVHSLKEAKVWNPKKKNRKTGEMGAYEVRKQSNMQEASSFFFDLDVGAEDHKYPTQVDAFQALKQFVKDTGLPLPMVTSSGGGLHVYWVVDTSLTSTEWVTTAARLKALAAHYGLKVDPARTTDTASVLRVAGTFNMKDKANPREVKVVKPGKPADLDEFLKRVTDAVNRAGVTPEAAKPKKTYTEVDDYFGPSNMQEMEFDGPPVKFMEVLKACPLMVNLTKRAAELSNPEWYYGLGVVSFCDDGRRVGHKWSSKYPGYNRDETDAKIDQQLQFQPTTCAKLQDECGAEKCDGCALRGKVKNPLMAARGTTVKELSPVTVGPEEAQIELAICPPPFPYRILKTGEVVIVSKNGQGDETTNVLYDRPLYPLTRIRNDSQETEHLVWRVEHVHDKTKDFILDADALADSRKFAGNLILKGSIYVDPDNLGLLRQYMIAYIRELQKRMAADVQQNYLGWNADQTEFTMHDKIICEGGVIKPAQLSTNAQRAAAGFGKKGTLEKQIELLQFYNRPEYIPHQVMILQGLAAVAFYATGQHGCVVNATGDPGASKSTALYTAASMFANPEEYTLNGTTNGMTHRARTAVIGVLSSLPVCVDEITKMDPTEAADMAISVTQPRSGKKGLKQDGTLRADTGVSADGGFKSSLLLTTANSSLQGLLAQDGMGNTAGAVRVIEIYFANPGVHQKWEAEKFLRELKQNYGHIGEAFVKLWLTDKQKHQEMVEATMREVDEEGRITSGERFWGCNFSALLASGRIAFAEGLIPFDMDAIKKWLLEFQLVKMRGVVTQEFGSSTSLLGDYLAQITGDMVVTDKMNNSVDTVRKPRGPLLAHYHMDKKVMWVLRSAFRDYCAKRKVNYLAALDDLNRPRATQIDQSTLIVPHTNIRRVLGTGTDYANGQAWVFEVDMAHPEISGSMPVVVTEKPALSPERAKLKAVEKP